MTKLGILVAMVIAIGGASALGHTFVVSGVDAPDNGVQMTLQEEIAAERAGDIAAANLGDVWLEPGETPGEARSF